MSIDAGESSARRRGGHISFTISLTGTKQWLLVWTGFFMDIKRGISGNSRSQFKILGYSVFEKVHHVTLMIEI